MADSSLAPSPSYVNAWLRTGPGGHTWQSSLKRCNAKDRIKIERDTAWKALGTLWKEEQLRGFSRDAGPYKGKLFAGWEKTPIKIPQFSNSPTTSI